MGKNKNNMKPKANKKPNALNVTNDQLGENASGYERQNEKYQNKK